MTLKTEVMADENSDFPFQEYIKIVNILQYITVILN